MNKKITQLINKFLILMISFQLIQFGPLTEWRISQVFVNSGIAVAADNVMPDCTPEDMKNQESANADEGTKAADHMKSGKCKVSVTEYNDETWMVVESYISAILMWVVALLFMFQVMRCRQPHVSCGWATGFAAVGGLALIAGEIASIVGFAQVVGDLMSKIEYRFDQVKANVDKCESSTGPTDKNGSGSLDGKSVCDQIGYLKAQRDAMEGAKTAATWKMWLAVAGAAAFAIAAIIELIRHLLWDAERIADVAFGSSLQGVFQGLVASCTLGAAACEAACAPCIGAVGAATMMLNSFLEFQNNLAPSPSKIQCERYRMQAATNFFSTQTACLTPPNPCTAAAQAFITQRQKDMVEANCTGAKPCLLGCIIPGTLITKSADPKENHYSRSSKTCSVNDNYIFTSRESLNYFEFNLLEYLPKRKNSHLDKLIFPTKSEISNFVYNQRDINEGFLAQNHQVRLVESFSVTNIRDYEYYKRVLGEEILTSKDFEFLKIIFPEAKAEGKVEDDKKYAGSVNQIVGNSIGMAGSAALLLTGLLVKVDLQMDGVFSTPIKRFGWDLLAAALAGAQAVTTKYAVIQPLDENIEKLNNILKAGKVADRLAVAGAGTGQAVPYNEVVLDNSFFETPPPSLPPDAKLACPSGAGDGKGGCKPAIGNNTDFGGAINLQGLSGLAGAVGALEKGLISRDKLGNGTLAAAGGLAKAGKDIKKKLKGLQVKYNKELAKRNKNPVNFDKIVAGQFRKLAGITNAHLAANGTTAQAFAASLGGGAKLDQTDVNKNLQEAAKAAAAAAKVAPITPETLNFEELGGAGDTTTGGDTSLQAGGESAPAKDLDGSFEVPNNDIFGDPNADIFKMLSSRYLKTAYPVFFEEEKAAPAPGAKPATEPEKK